MTADDDCAWFDSDTDASGRPHPPRPPLKNHPEDIFRYTFQTLSGAPDVKLSAGLQRILVAITDGRRHLLGMPGTRRRALARLGAARSGGTCPGNVG